ncbi:unnamed protein product [Cyprideis torosa]|uniref:Uncharacterized protein n=1 Tax=Cyprideis torosa TaxID=163714 RepID=A0A7R8ZIC7_9CRUS|nr:unnamed protein product [Cyprideis torosa]CAG0879664.1 unnamed protein product [Cyprideis torosa]
MENFEEVEKRSDARRGERRLAPEPEKSALRPAVSDRLRQLGNIYGGKEPEDRLPPVPKIRTAEREQLDATLPAATTVSQDLLLRRQRLAKLATEMNSFEDEVTHRKVSHEKPIQWDDRLLSKLESQGYVPTESKSKLTYEFEESSGSPRARSISPTKVGSGSDGAYFRARSQSPNKRPAPLPPSVRGASANAPPSESNSKTAPKPSTSTSQTRKGPAPPPPPPPQTYKPITMSKSSTDVPLNTRQARNNGESLADKRTVSQLISEFDSRRRGVFSDHANEETDPSLLPLSQRAALFEKNEGALPPKPHILGPRQPTPAVASQQTPAAPSHPSKDKCLAKGENASATHKMIAENLEEGWKKSKIAQKIAEEKARDMEIVLNRFRLPAIVAENNPTACASTKEHLQPKHVGPGFASSSPSRTWTKEHTSPSSPNLLSKGKEVCSIPPPPPLPPMREELLPSESESSGTLPPPLPPVPFQIRTEISVASVQTPGAAERTVNVKPGCLYPSLSDIDTDTEEHRRVLPGAERW